MATLKDVASLSGVSLATVSRVLSNSAPVKESTRICVENAARQLNYTPNLAARSLRTKNSRLIGISTEGNTNYMFSHLINYIADYCFENDYGLVVANHDNDPQREARIFDSMRQRGVEGMIVSLVSRRSHIIPNIIQSDIPIVIFDRYLIFDQMAMGENNFSIVLDNYEAGRLAARHLLQLGHRRIALAQGPSDFDITRIRTKGFYDELADANMFLPPAYRFKGGFAFEDGQEVAKKILALGDKGPTAVWAQNDLMAAGIECELTRGGLRVPEDISVMGMDGIELSRLTSPPISTVVQPFRDMARTAVEMLLGGCSERRAVFTPTVITRESTRAPK